MTRVFESNEGMSAYRLMGHHGGGSCSAGGVGDHGRQTAPRPVGMTPWLRRSGDQLNARVAPAVWFAAAEGRCAENRHLGRESERPHPTAVVRARGRRTFVILR
jgi:hypothetical protein